MKKTEALELYKKNNKLVIYTINNYGNYYTSNNYTQLQPKLQQHNIFEYIHGTKPCIFYLDIDIKISSPETKSNYCEQVNQLILHIEKTLPKFPKISILSSHSTTKLSYHIFARMYDMNNEIMFENNQCLQNFLENNKYYKLFPFVDRNVYKQGGGLFRCLYASKPNETRPLIRDPLSKELWDEIKYFIHYVTHSTT